jgi:SAM-dependent methyltransferase
VAAHPVTHEGNAPDRVVWLPDRPFEGEHPYAATPDHPSRALLDRLLAEPADDGAWDQLSSGYDRQAAAWDSWTSSVPQYLAALDAALQHVPPGGTALEVCCGPGTATRHIAMHASTVTATDASAEMIRRAPDIDGVTWLCADVRSLPFPDSSFDLVVGLNAVPHGPELARVCAAGGSIAWASSFGPDTPLYISPEALCERLGGSWTGTAGRIGRGVWCVYHRSRP